MNAVKFTLLLFCSFSVKTKCLCAHATRRKENHAGSESTPLLQQNSVEIC